MIDNKKVSIVVPVFNQERFLEKSLSSLINQSYKELEIIIINDGSTDNSLKIIKKYQQLDKRIQIYSKINQGLASAVKDGIKLSSGEYLCFLDPDDYFGEKFVENFLDEMDDEYDFISSGYYENFNGTLMPIFLKEDLILERKEILDLKENFILDKSNGEISRTVFISRWNKIYKTSLLKKIVDELNLIKEVTLGEDTLFTYLILCNSYKAKIINAPNSYIYNVSNQNSMMNSSDVERYINKCDVAKKNFELIMDNHHENDICKFQSSYLFYFLILSLLKKDLLQNKNNNIKKIIKRNDNFRISRRIIIKNTKGKTRLKVKLNLSNKKLRKFVFLDVRNFYHNFAFIKKNVYVFIKDIFKFGVINAIRKFKHRNRREKAFHHVNLKLPEIERKIVKIINEYKYHLKPEESPKKIFVFWWDGFNRAPTIVNKCLKKLKKSFNEYEIIEIDKSNYERYTNINKKIIEGFKKNKISIQTFSDILRFNLLKNNGGVWVDSTIFFGEKYDILDIMGIKDFESISFSSSQYFLEYKNEHCNWSGYFISSKKNGYFVSLMDYIFEKYYEISGDYTTYFFIDAAFIICKICKVDNEILNLIHYNDNDMFLLSKVLTKKFHPWVYDLIINIPQKLSWDIKYEKIDAEWKKILFEIG